MDLKVDAQAVIQKLMQRISQLEYENAMMAAALDAVESGQTDEE